MEHTFHEPQPEYRPEVRRATADSTVQRWFAVALWFVGGVALGAMAGQWSHAFSAIVLVLPVVVLAARLARRHVSGVIAVGAMTAWALVRMTTTDESTGSFLLTLTMSLLVLSAAGWLIESLLRTRQRAAHFAATEPLTGLLNRSAFFARLELEMTRCHRHSHPLSVVFLDCDGFKAFNDSQGHRAGDELLQAIAETLQAGTRGYDVVARLGGDEFALLFPEISADDAERVVHRLHDEVRREIAARNFPLTVSIGLAVFAEPPKSTSEAMDVADRLMYEAKNSGKDRVVSLRQSGKRLALRPLSQAPGAAGVPEPQQDRKSAG